MVMMIDNDIDIDTDDVFVIWRIVMLTMTMTMLLPPTVIQQLQQQYKHMQYQNPY